MYTHIYVYVYTKRKRYICAYRSTDIHIHTRTPNHTLPMYVDISTYTELQTHGIHIDTPSRY